MGRAILLLGLVLGLVLGLYPRGSQSDVDAGTAVRLDIAGMVEAADIVFEGYTREATVLRTPAGRIETEYTFDVDRCFLGDTAAQLRVRIPGGVLPDGYGLLLPGMPGLHQGEEVLLFLSEPGTSGVRMPVGLSQGKFHVETNLSGERCLTRQHGSLTVIDPATGRSQDASGAEVFDYARTTAEIYAAVSRKEPK